MIRIPPLPLRSYNSKTLYDIIFPLLMSWINLSKRTIVLSFHREGWPLVVARILRRWFEVKLYVRAVLFNLGPRWACLRPYRQLRMVTLVASELPAPPLKPACFISFMCDAASSGVWGVTLYSSYRDVLPYSKNFLKNRSWVLSLVNVHSSMQSKVHLCPMYRKAPKYNNSIGDDAASLLYWLPHDATCEIVRGRSFYLQVPSKSRVAFESGDETSYASVVSTYEGIRHS